MLGYKVMKTSQDGTKLISGANSDIVWDAKCQEVTMKGNGIYMSNNKEYVLDYYSGLADNEALITFEFDKENITFGNLEDREVEIAVKKAKIINIEYLD